MLFHQICCPGCFKLYDISNTTQICSYKESPRSQACGQALQKKDGKPKRLYSTQSLIAWITGLLQMPEIESQLDQRCQHISPPDGSQWDVWDSPLWKELLDRDGQPFFSMPGRLGFSMFFDGFNPYGNKVAGVSFLNIQ